MSTYCNLHFALRTGSTKDMVGRSTSTSLLVLPNKGVCGSTAQPHDITAIIRSTRSVMDVDVSKRLLSYENFGDIMCLPYTWTQYEHPWFTQYHISLTI